MTKRDLPALNGLERPKSLEPGSAPIKCFDRWSAGLKFTAQAAGTVIDITDVIGIDPWTGEGVDAAYVLSKLRGAGDVTVNINSPGGDYFEGAAIYELLRGHQGSVTVNILGLAASAASIIAMSGDEIRMGQTGFVMIHNCWGICIGDRHDMEGCSQVQSQIDAAMQTVYADRTKQNEAAIAAMMDAETWIGAKDAIEKGFVDAILPPGTVGADAQYAKLQQPVMAQRRLDALMAQHGHTRADRRRMFNEIKRGTHDAAAREGTHDAAQLSALVGDARALLETFQ